MTDRAPETSEQPRCHHCGALTAGGRFLPGHDAKHVANLVMDVRAQAVTYEQALGDCPSVALQNKVTQGLRRAGWFARTDEILEAFNAHDEKWGTSLLHYAYSRFTAEGRERTGIPSGFRMAHALSLHFPTKTGREIVRQANFARS